VRISRVGEDRVEVIPADRFGPSRRQLDYVPNVCLEWVGSWDLLPEQELLALRAGAPVAISDDEAHLMWFVRDIDGRNREMVVATLVLSRPQERTVSFDLIRPLDRLPSSDSADAARAWSVIQQRLGPLPPPNPRAG